jgi:hypothetical protein
MARAYDPDLLYAECSRCGEPVLLDTTQTIQVVQWSGLDLAIIDLTYMIVSDGCPLCAPEDEYYVTHVVRFGGEPAAYPMG